MKTQRSKERVAAMDVSARALLLWVERSLYICGREIVIEQLEATPRGLKRQRLQ